MKRSLQCSWWCWFYRHGWFSTCSIVPILGGTSKIRPVIAFLLRLLYLRRLSQLLHFVGTMRSMSVQVRCCSPPPQVGADNEIDWAPFFFQFSSSFLCHFFFWETCVFISFFYLGFFICCHTFRFSLLGTCTVAHLYNGNPNRRNHCRLLCRPCSADCEPPKTLARVGPPI